MAIGLASVNMIAALPRGQYVTQVFNCAGTYQCLLVRLAGYGGEGRWYGEDFHTLVEHGAE